MAGASVDDLLMALAREAERLALSAETATPARPAEAAAQYWAASLIWQHYRRTSQRDYNQPATSAHRAAAAASSKTSAKAIELAKLAAAATDQPELF
ncbi:MAG: hypothetical protein V3T07_09005 [Myxococcota bacterium]